MAGKIVFLKLVFTGKVEAEREEDRDRLKEVFHLPVCFKQQLRLGQAAVRNLELNQSPTWATGPQVLRSLPAAYQGAQEQDVKIRSETRTQTQASCHGAEESPLAP